MNQQEAFALAKRYKEALHKANIPFSMFIVFGSAAKGPMHEQSDVDIAVVGRPFKKDRFEEMSAIRRLRRPISYKLQPIWFYPEHLNDPYSTLAREIQNAGVSL